MNTDDKINFMFKWNKNKAYKLLYDNYYHLLITVSIGITKDYETTSDLIQNLFLKIEQERRYLYIKEYENYLVRSIKNMSLIEVRNQSRRHQIINELDFGVLIDDDIDPRIEEIKKYIPLLPDSCREIFEKIIFEEWTYESVAYDRKISINTVKTQMRRAVKFIREKTAQ